VFCVVSQRLRLGRAGTGAITFRRASVTTGSDAIFLSNLNNHATALTHNAARVHPWRSASCDPDKHACLLRLNQYFVMTRSHHRIAGRLARLCISVPLCIFAACGRESPTTPMPTSVQSISVAPNANGLTVGNTLTVVATAFNGAGAVVGGQTFTWSNSNASIATVTSVGLVTGVAAAMSPFLRAPPAAREA